MLRPIALALLASTLALPALAGDLGSARLRVVVTDADGDEQVVSDEGTYVELTEGHLVLVRAADTRTDAIDVWAYDGSELTSLSVKNRDVDGERVTLYGVTVSSVEEDANGNQFLSIEGSTTDPDAASETSSAWDVSRDDAA